MTSVMSLQFSMQEEHILEHAIAQEVFDALAGANAMRISPLFSPP